MGELLALRWPTTGICWINLWILQFLQSLHLTALRWCEFCGQSFCELYREEVHLFVIQISFVFDTELACPGIILHWHFLEIYVLIFVGVAVICGDIFHFARFRFSLVPRRENSGAKEQPPDLLGSITVWDRCH